MDFSSNKECPVDIQIPGRAREINEISPHPDPQFVSFLFIIRFSRYKLQWRATKRPVNEEKGVCSGAEGPTTHAFRRN